MPSAPGRPSRRTFLRRVAHGSLLSGLICAGALLTACQTPTSPPKPSDATPIPPRPTPQPTPTPLRPADEVKPAALATPPLGPPKPGGAIVWGADMAADPLDLDPHGPASERGAPVWADLVYQSLVMYDGAGRLTPALAEAWVMSDPLTWTFTLRQGVRFHDGSEFEAEDVRAWFERLRAEQTASPYRDWYSQVVKVEPRGRYEVTFTLSAPFAPLLATLASLRGSAIAPRRWLARGGDATKLTAVGSGPYRIAEYVPGSHVTYQKHADYWERTLPYLDTLTLRFLPDEAARLTLVEPGQAVGVGSVAPATATRLKTERTLMVLRAPGATQAITVLNTRRPPFDDVRVRQAISLAADRSAALAQVLSGEGALTGPIPPGYGGWALPQERLPTGRDVERARELLAEAGRPDGFEATVRTSPAVPHAITISRLLADQLREIGVTLHVEEMPAAAFSQATAAHDFELCSVRVGFLPDPDTYCSQLYHTNGGQNWSGWSNGAFDTLVNNARTVMVPGQRKAIYDEAAGLLLDEAPAIWWFTEHTLEAVSNEVTGYTPAYRGGRAPLKTTWLAR